jgi:hypothetical protein
MADTDPGMLGDRTTAESAAARLQSVWRGHASRRHHSPYCSRVPTSLFGQQYPSSNF